MGANIGPTTLAAGVLCASSQGIWKALHRAPRRGENLISRGAPPRASWRRAQNAYFEFTFLPTRKLWRCKTKHPRRQFSVKVGTIFEDSPLGLDKWLPAFWLVVKLQNRDFFL